MSDIEIIRVLEGKIGQPFPHTLSAGRCIELSLCHKDAIFFGLVRHQSPAGKQEIIRLISCLTGLRTLDLRRNRLGVLPPEFSQLMDLEHLNLSSNYLGGFPGHVRNFRKLKSLYLGNNDLVELPAWLGELSELEHLALHKNIKLKSIAPVSALSRLRVLNLYYINLVELPEFIYGFQELTTLTLWNVRCFPDGLETLKNLEFFTHCGGLSLRTLPKGFTRLRKLRMARLYQNNLEMLPEDFGDLENLEQLSLYQNQLSGLPDSMALLQRLQKLNLGWNNFETFPDWLNNLQNLQWLGLYANTIKKPSQIKCRPGLQIDYEWPFSTVKAMN